MVKEIEKELETTSQLTDEDFETLDKLFKEGFTSYVANSVGVTIVKHSYMLMDNRGLKASGFTKAPYLSLYLDTDCYDLVEVIYFLGMRFLETRGFTNEYVGEVVIDYVADYLEVYPVSDLD